MRIATFVVFISLTTILAADPTAPTDARARVEALQTAQKGDDEGAKKTAVENCGLTPHAGTAVALAAILAKESDALRISAAQSLGKMKGITEAVQVLHGAIGANLRKPAVLEAIFVAIGTLADNSSIGICRDSAVQLAATKDPLMATAVRAALAALGSIRHKDSVDALISARAKLAANAASILAETLAAADNAAAAAQAKLTGGDSTKAEEFAKWWKRHGSEFNNDLSKRPVGMRRGPGNMGGGMGGQ
ncbi:MAG: hypothetical protein K8T20_04200 [Planctomycetes bacterium]|nr:hypothetical protein [Planctomycetota bacterium]